MRITRVTDRSGRLTCIRIGPGAIGFRSLVGTIRRLHGVSDVRVNQGWPLTRDEAIRFRIQEQEFMVDAPFSDFCLQPASPDCPMQLFEQVASHLERSRIPWFRRIL